MPRKLFNTLLIIALCFGLLQLSLYVYLHYGKSTFRFGSLRLPSSSTQASLGINTNEISYLDASMPFIDLFRPANPFQDNVLHLPPATIVYDGNGWPSNLNGGQAGTRFLGELPADTIPAGHYTVLYDGEGELRYGNDAKLLSHAQGRDTIDLDAGTNGRLDASLIIVQSNPANPLRNIRILPPGGICRHQPEKRVADANACTAETGEYLSFVEHYDSIIFNPDYLDFMKDFRTIRFMPISGITRNPVVHWQDRPHLQKATWGGNYSQRGAPLEIMVELANRLHKDAWFNLPHAADDEYVREFATYVRDNLDPDLKIYLEYSNEVWNATFNHREYTQQQGIARGLSRNAVEAGYRFYALRSREVFNIWEQVFGNHERFVRVIGGWDTRADFAKEVLSYQDTYQYADALAIAPYFGGNIKGFREAKTVDDIFALTTAPDSYRSLPQVLEHVKKQADIAAQFGLDLLGYEGGQGLVDWATRKPEQMPNPLFYQANRDPRMGELYSQFLTGWSQAGGKLLMLFSAPRACGWYGCWGLKESIRQPLTQAPKYAAVMQFMQNHLPWWTEQSLPKPVSMPVAKPADPNRPLIAWRPANDPQSVFQLDNPQTLENLLEGEHWSKQDLYGKWQVKWDKDNLFLSVRVYDDKRIHDSPDPRDDDSVELFIDTTNSRALSMDRHKAFHMIFPCSQTGLVLSSESAPLTSEVLEQISVDRRVVYDGYILEAWIPWSVLGMQPKVSDKVSAQILINDDDDGGSRDARLSWMAIRSEAINHPAQWGTVLFSGR